MRYLLSKVTENSEAALIVLLILIMFLMIIPMPFWLVDTMIALNLSIAILLAVLAIYIRQPLEISTFPSILLISVLFRLALSITTTRLILTTGSGGNIVSTFGDFVVGGNIVVGIVIFLIITLVQFIVITKGSERIAEVSARFTLDAMPGKQLSIDSDLRNGIINTDQARNARKVLGRQAQFYGAMDGATKFVKGDAIAGLVITVVNLVGGLIIGMAQLGMPFSEALAVYSQQTVGDGLVAQIPALFIAIAAGSVVTRVADDGSENLGKDIGTELIAHPRTLVAVALVLLVFGVIPGFPTIIFVGLSISFFIAGYARHRQIMADDRHSALPTSDFDAVNERMERIQPMSPLSLQIGEGLARDISSRSILETFDEIREEVFSTDGLWLPPIGLAIAKDLPEDSYEILLDAVSKLKGRLPADHVELVDEPDFATLSDVAFTKHDDVIPGRLVHLVQKSECTKLSAHGIGYRPPEKMMAEALKMVIKKSSSHFVGLEETSLLLTHFEKQYGELVTQVKTAGSIHQLSLVLRNLIAEGVSIRNLRAIFQSYLDWVKKEQDPIILAEYVRTSLKDQLCRPYVESDDTMAVILLKSDVEDLIRGSIQESSVGSYLALDADRAGMLTSGVRHFWELATGSGTSCVLVTSLDIRRYVRNALKLNNVDIPVFSYQDVALDIRVHPLGVVDFLEAPENG